ncbi:hypothetical protein U9M48_044731 [Paspalum notatum var. saurae]|uniref:DUF4408 domain-containing protein n=1 Tax=Paspalum notatum var. saurae TaxID=547442 RepID=A0AAQ3UVP0_PASNO
MDGADAAPTLGAWASIRGFFTPATLFLVVNLVIGTIALTSRATQQRRRRERYYQFHYHDDGHLHHDPLHPQQQQEYHHYYPQEQAMYAPPPLARTSSVLDRLRSFGLYRFRSGDFPPEYGAAGPHDAFAPVVEPEQPHYARSRSEPAAPLSPAREEERRPAAREVRRSQAARAPARVVEEAVAENDYVGARAEETAVGRFRREPSPLQREYQHYQEEEEYVPPVRAPAAPAPLQRTSSVLDRLRSFGLYGFLAPEQPAAAATLAVAGEKQHAHYDRSRSEPAREQQGRKEKKQEVKSSRIAKSSSAARKAGAPSLAEGVDARAEAFIDSFRQQQVQHHHREQEEYVPPPAPAPLPRTSSVLDRLRSFGLYRFRSGDLGPDLPAAAAAAAETPTPAADEKEKKHEAHYGRSRSEPAREPGKREPRMSKSSSSVVEEAEADHGVDARADDFINKFRQQLQLQRLNSLLNYKEMLGRGGAGGKQ